VEMLEDGVASRPRLRGGDDGVDECRHVQPKIGREPGHPVAAEARVDVGRPLVPTQERGEERSDGHLLAVKGGAGAEPVDGMADLVARPAARTAGAGGGHRQPADHERIGERGEQGIVAQGPLLVEHRQRRRRRHCCR